MSDLFIIGNGFDRAHGMETSYYNFHQFIKDNCKNMPYTGVVELLSQDSENKIDGMIVYEPIEYLDFFQIIIDQTDGPDWKNFEDALGRLDFSDVLRDYGTNYDTDSIKYLNGRSIESINQAVLTVKEMFPLWVKSILIDNQIKKKDRIQEMLKGSHYILNFNYTDTLEKLYGEKNVFHIHGNQNSDIIFGHGNYVDEEFDDEEFEIYPGADSYLNMMKAELKKPVDRIIERAETQNFLDSIKDVTKIYSYGFSYGSVDLPYIVEICRRIDTYNVTWYFNDYSSDYEIKKYQEIVKKCGFKGYFSTFHV